MRTKEEILKLLFEKTFNQKSGFEGSLYHTVYGAITVQAMQTYADQECAEFKIRFFAVIKQMRRRWLVQVVENKKLKDRNDALVTELFCANKRIAELKRRVADLESHLSSYVNTTNPPIYPR